MFLPMVSCSNFLHNGGAELEGVAPMMGGGARLGTCSVDPYYMSQMYRNLIGFIQYHEIIFKNPLPAYNLRSENPLAMEP